MQDPTVYGGRKARRQIDQSHNPSPATNTRDSHGEEGKTRTEFHPLQGGSKGMTVGKYLGSTGTPGGVRSHMFDARATGGGESDSFMVHDTDSFKWNPESNNRSGMYAFDREQGHSGTVRPYSSEVHYGMPGAPMSDTPAKYHDRNYW
jgi:hypothetical protein